MAAMQPEPSSPILKKGIGRYKDVRRANLIILGKVSDAIKPALGPHGMSKMLVAPTGDVSVTNSGRAILENMATSNQITKLMIDAARTQGDISGDGTKTAAVLTGELLKKANALLKMKVHPRVIIEGYQKAGKRALEVLDKNSISLSLDDEEGLINVAKTAIGGRETGKPKEHLAKLIVSAIESVAETNKGKVKVDLDNVVLRKKDGGSAVESCLVKGIIIYKDKPHPQMPDKTAPAKLALIGSAIDPFIYETGDALHEYTITAPGEMRRFKEGEDKVYEDFVKTIRRAGANSLFCQKRVSKAMQAFLAREGVLAFDLVSEKDMVRLARATGGSVVTRLEELTPRDIGSAGTMEFRNISGDEMLFIEDCPYAKALTLLIRGGTAQVAGDIEGIADECLRTVAIALEEGKALWGGGAIEMEICKEMKDYSKSVATKEQLAIDAFGDAVEEIPRALATNAGIDCINAITELREKHGNGAKDAGIQAIGRKMPTATSEAVLDSFKAKQHAINIATETATMVLGISDIIMVTSPAAIKRGEAEKEMEQKRIQDEKLRVAFKEKESLKEVTKLDHEMMDRVMHPDTY